MAYRDTLFPVNISQGAMCEIIFSTTVTTVTSGFEKRQKNWNDPLRRFDVSHILEDDAKRYQLIEFFIAVRGMGDSFRFHDWMDYFIGLTWSGGNLIVGTPHQFGTGDGSQTVFQLSRTYSAGLNPQIRKITKPETTGIKIYKNDVEQTSGVSVNASTGLVTFTSPPTNGHTLKWAGKFYNHCRFETDRLPLTLDTPHVGEMGGIGILEVRE